MIRPIALLLITTVAIAGCSRIATSRVNPMNWFGTGKSTEATVYTSETAPALVPATSTIADQRPLIETISVVDVARTTSGAILRATGVAAMQGGFNAELVLSGIEKGVATYDFRVELPKGIQVQGASATREITAAKALSTSDLRGIRSFVVRGAKNSKSAR